MPRGRAPGPGESRVVVRSSLAPGSAVEGDDGTNDLLVSNVIRTNEMQVWFIAERVVDGPLVHADRQADT